MTWIVPGARAVSVSEMDLSPVLQRLAEMPELLGSLKELLRIPGCVDQHATQRRIVRVKLTNRVDNGFLQIV